MQEITVRPPTASLRFGCCNKSITSLALRLLSRQSLRLHTANPELPADRCEAMISIISTHQKLCNQFHPAYSHDFHSNKANKYGANLSIVLLLILVALLPL